MHFFSDGAPAQFKNKYLMRWISKVPIDYSDVDCVWNFFATSHGRGVWDGEGGRLKRKMLEVSNRSTVCGEIPIPNAQAIYDWSKTDEGKRWCMEVEEENPLPSKRLEIEKRRIKSRKVHLLKGMVHRTQPKDVDGIPGIRNKYAVQSCKKKDRVLVALVSCYCAPCLRDESEHCESDEALGEWVAHDF